MFIKINLYSIFLNVPDFDKEMFTYKYKALFFKFGVCRYGLHTINIIWTTHHQYKKCIDMDYTPSISYCVYRYGLHIINIKRV